MSSRFWTCTILSLGAVLNFQTIEPVQGWRKTAPDLTSTNCLWQKWGDSAMLAYLKSLK